MIDEKKLNTLLVAAKSGCTTSLWEIRAYFWKDISELSEKYASVIKSQLRFEESCYARIDLSVKKFEPNRGGFSRYVRFKFYELAKLHVDRGRKQTALSLEWLADNSTDRNGNSQRFELQDGLAIVDANYYLNEKVASLAGDDDRRLSILNAWIYGCYNDSAIAAFLAERHGGKPDSYRRFITRFKADCQMTLSKAN